MGKPSTPQPVNFTRFIAKLPLIFKENVVKHFREFHKASLNVETLCLVQDYWGL